MKDTSEAVRELQSALDFVMLKTLLQRLGVVGGGYGLIACMYGVPSSHPGLYLIHIVLGAALVLTSILSFVHPSPKQTIFLGAQVVLTGVWINVMASFGEGAGGSATVFAVWGAGLAFVGITGLANHRRFAYLCSQMPSATDTHNAGILVKKLLSANPNKQQDLIFIHIKVIPEHIQHLSLSKRIAVMDTAGKWKARLLSDLMVLVQNGAAKALVVRKGDFGDPTILELQAADLGCAHSLRILEQPYAAVVDRKFEQRFKEWLQQEG